MDLEAVLEGAPHAVDVAEVVNSRASRLYTRLQRPDERLAQTLPSLAGQLAGGCKRMDPRAMESLIRVNVSDARDSPLVQHERLDRGCAPACKGEQMLDGEAILEWLEAQTLLEEPLERLASEQELPRAEAAWIDDRQ